MHVLIDDCRDFGDVIVRDPRQAITVLRKLHKVITSVSWDNDMGHGWEFEGRNLLKQFLNDCVNQKIFPDMYIVTSNTVAKIDMIKTLESYGYKFLHDDNVYRK